MENKTTEAKTGSLVCRKCSGPHLTIKCGKDKIVIDETLENEQKPEIKGRKTYYELRELNGSKDTKDTKITQKTEELTINQPQPVTYDMIIERDRTKKKFFKSTYRVKLSNLPTDTTEEEMMELTCDWGNIVRIKLLTYEESATAYIDFGYMDEATYFVEAIDKTPFDYLLLSAIIVDSN
jgi:hypothetical protein